MDRQQFQLSKRWIDCATALAALVLCTALCFHLYSAFLSAVSRYDSLSREHSRALFLRTEAEVLFINSSSSIVQSTVNMESEDHAANFSKLGEMPALSVNEIDGVNGFGHGVFVRGKDTLSSDDEYIFFSQAKYLSNIENTVWQDTYKNSRRFLVASAADELFGLSNPTNDWKNWAQYTPAELTDYLTKVREPIRHDYSAYLGKSKGPEWTEPHVSPVHEETVITCYEPVFNNQGALLSFLASEIPVSDLVDRKWLQKHAMSVAIFDSRQRLVVADTGFEAVDMLRKNAHAVSGISNLDYEVDGGWLLIYVVVPQSQWQMVYGVPLATVLADNAVALGFTLATLIIGLVGVFLTARGLRNYLLAPVQRNGINFAEGQELIRVLMDHSPVGLCLIRRSDGVVLIQNEQSDQLLKLVVREGGQLCLLQEYLLKVPANTLPDASRAEVEVQASDSDKQVHILATLKDFQFYDEPVLFCAVVDYSERNYAQLLLTTAKKAADEANAAKSAFLAMMSHEIRTPMYGVLGTLELLASTGLQPQQLDYLNTIELSSSNLLQIINDILDFSKVEANQLTLEFATLDLIDLVESVARGFLPIAWKKCVELYACLQPDMPLLTGDRNRLQQILNNLLSNAVKFTDSGKIVVRLSGIEIEPGQFDVKLQITDSGIGIAKAAQMKLFEPFIQADNSTARRFGGTGLGLSICRRLVQLMGGEIELVSELGLGSSFTVSLRLPIAGKAPSLRLNDFPTIHVLANASDLRENLQAQIQFAGGQAQAFGSKRSSYAMTDYLVVAWPHGPETETGDNFAAVVWLEPDGVTTPQWREDGWHVSCLSQHGLLEALQLANGKAPMVSSPTSDPSPERLYALRILAVEDHPINQLVLTEQLERLGCQVTMASDGLEALHLWQRGETFDVMLTDVNMPRLDGYELTRQLRADGIDVLIVGVTANAHAEEEELCLQAGMNAHLAKPVSLTSLRQTLSALGAVVKEPAKKPSKASILLSMIEKDPAMRELLVSTISSDWLAIMAANSEGNAVLVSQSAHRLKGALATVGLTDAAEICSCIETLAVADQLTQIDELLQRLKQSLNFIWEAPP